MHFDAQAFRLEIMYAVHHSDSHKLPTARTQDYHLPQHHLFQQLHLPITLRHPLQFILLLDRIRITAPLRSIDQLFSQALGHALHIPERSLPRTDGQEGDRLVDAAQGRDIDGLTADGTGAADTGGVFARTAVDDCVDGDLERVCVGHDVNLLLGVSRAPVV